jgi:hypothetical protein
MAWSDAARAAALEARRRNARRRKVPTVGQNRDEMARLLATPGKDGARLRARVGSNTLLAMAEREARHPSSELVGGMGGMTASRYAATARLHARLGQLVKRDSARHLEAAARLRGLRSQSMHEAAPGVFQRRDVFARTLKAARAQARRSGGDARYRNLHARVIAGRMVQAEFGPIGGRR